ncbi:MAG TPA: ImmA/IrrE family metallo-endopeptidase [Candidatus Saccharimonadia bacterium]|nr:ImmA/IrrE family metallo-endopeptidase [Candidatus Saccharimonadia bacterium]
MNSFRSTDQSEAAATALLESVFGDIEHLKLPVDIDRIVRHCQLTVLQGQFGRKNVIGELDRQKRQIKLVKSNSFQDKNFIAAHELGHFKLHHESFEIMHAPLSDILDGSKDAREREADRFAASLTMPEARIRKWWNLTSNLTLLAQVFGVPKVAVFYRLKQLNLIK